ncbi:MAG: hypothetical protein LBF12_06055 [Christensenellaceae bacterium]|jgi:hypothetical protein|nr:hypothetical protein [Christensenellaceae bacterium]
MKKTVLRLSLMMTLVLLFVMVLVACDPKPTDKSKTTPIVQELAALTDYSTSKTYYDPAAVEYEGDVKTKNEQDLAAKILVERTNTGYDADTFTWDDDVSTARKIFTLSKASDILERFSKAALKQEKMNLLVKYIVRSNDNNSKPYELEIGKGDFLNDYDELEDLNDIYDEDEDTKITINGKERYITEVLRLKEYKMMGELAQIFGESGDELARVAVEIVAYSQKVVDVEMRAAYEAAINKYYVADSSENVNTFDGFMKAIIFDYETLSYYKAFNVYVSLNDDYIPTVKASMVKLYGFHYAYQLKDYMFWSEKYTRSNYEEYLALGVKEYFNTLEEAKQYTKYDREHYAYAYRYTASFYAEYYNTHFTFQNEIEKQEKTVYKEKYGDNQFQDMSDAGTHFTTSSGGKTYSEQMMTSIKSTRMQSLLVMSDINYEYTGIEANVKSYQEKSKAYLSLSESLRDKIENDEERSNYYEDILYVEYQVERIKPETYFLSHSLLKTNATKINNIPKDILENQIYSYNADTIRGIQSLKKDNVILLAEIDRENKKEDQDKNTALIAQKEDEIARNKIVKDNIDSNYSSASIPDQLTSAGSHSFDDINRDLTAVQVYSYATYHNEIIRGKPRYQVIDQIQVKEFFEDFLVKRVWKAGPDVVDTNVPDDQKNEQNGWTKEYDTTWSISRFLNTHETILRYANSQVVITYKNADGVYSKYSLSTATNTTMNRSDDFTIESTSGNYITWESKYPGAGIFSGEIAASNKPVLSDYIKTYKEETLNNGDKPTIAIWKNGTGSAYDRWVGNSGAKAIVIKYNENGYTNSKGETYFFEFAGWFLDKDFKYIVRPDDTFDYDMVFYPAFYVTRIR